MISPDKPKLKLEDDQFERTKYAENLAKIIIDQSNQEGFVIGVYGTWGSGKSTFFEYILHYLEQSSNNSLITVVRFNPWWFSGKQDLTIALLSELQSQLSTELTKLLKKLGKIIATRIAPQIIKISQLSQTKIGILMAQIAKIFIFLIKIFLNTESIPKIKQNISDELKKVAEKY